MNKYRGTNRRPFLNPTIQFVVANLDTKYKQKISDTLAEISLTNSVERERESERERERGYYPLSIP